MGDRFYEQQKKHKFPRRLKKDIIADLNKLLETEVSGLDKLTIASLDELTLAIRVLKGTSRYSNTLKELAKS